MCAEPAVRPFDPEEWETYRMEPKTPWSWVLTVEQASKLLQISPNTCREALNRGELPGRKLLGQWRISVNALHDWLERQPVAPAPEHPDPVPFPTWERGGALRG